MEVKEKITKAIEESLKELGLDVFGVELEHPADPSHGDYSTNIAMTQEGNPRELAKKLVEALREKKIPNVEKIEIAGPGFVNFYLDRAFFTDSMGGAIKEKDKFGKNENLKGRKVMIEYTDPNPLKEFHIGHLMSNAIGESLSRLFEFDSAEVKRANYQGDVGVHVAKAVWGKIKNPDYPWGKAYAAGAAAYDEHKEEIDALNKKIYERSDEEINKLYNSGRKESLEEFEKIYKTLGTSFDLYFFESEVGGPGKDLVEKNESGIFEKSDGAIIFDGEKHGLHKRVFLNSEGLPTYEAKELGLAKFKYDKWKYDRSVIVTANEIDAYFQVLLKAMSFVYPELAEKTQHISHGILGLTTGKMSSRTGDVVTAVSLIESTKERVLEKMEEKDERIAEMVAVAALKYSILRQAPGKDIAFDMERSLSFEGDSGPYLQYTYVRTKSILEKAKEEKVEGSLSVAPSSVYGVEKLLYQFPEVVEKAANDYAPQYIVTYLTKLAGEFNTLYGREKIVDKDDKYSPFKLAVTEAVSTTLRNGLWLLGIGTPERM